MTTKFKLVICDVRDGSLISQSLPNLGVEQEEWYEVPGTRSEAGRYFQADYAARVPECECRDLPDHCYVVEKFDHVTKVNPTWQFGVEVLEIYYQNQEGQPIQSEVYA